MGVSKKPAKGPSRRKVLLTAVAAGVGVAGARVLGLRDLDAQRIARVTDPMAMLPAYDPDGMDASDPFADFVDNGFGTDYLDGSTPPMQPAPPLPPVKAAPAVRAATTVSQTPVTGLPAPKLLTGVDWISPLGSETARIAHLLRRATFGASDADLDRAFADGYAKTVDRLLETPLAEPPEYGAPQPRLAASPRPIPSPSASPSAAPSPIAAPSSSPMATAAPAMTNQTPIRINDLQAWWVDWMIRTPTPFAERMTLFWHGHFTSDFRKVGTNSPAIYWQNLTWRKMGLGDLKSMLLQVTTDLAMLRYLDLGVSTGRNPNENYARELLELFTMGVGGYTEDDVKAGAKALAGWRLPMRTERDARIGIYDAARAYKGAALTFLGKTATFDTPTVMDQILAQPTTAPFIVRELVSTFVHPAASQAYVNALADRYRRSGYDTKSLMRDILTSPEFVSPEAYRALIKSPTEFMVSSAKALGATNISRLIVQYGTTLGQNLFDPPSVAGWGEGASWISSNTMLQRANFLTAAIGQVRSVPSAVKAHERHLDGVLAQGTIDELSATRDDRSRWFAVLASPEFQLK